MIVAEKSFTCAHCSAKFSKEKTLIVHTCEPKRRHLAKSEKHVMIGYQTYNRFFQLNQKHTDTKSYENFAKRFEIKLTIFNIPSSQLSFCVDF